MCWQKMKAHPSIELQSPTIEARAAGHWGFFCAAALKEQSKQLRNIIDLVSPLMRCAGILQVQEFKQPRLMTILPKVEINLSTLERPVYCAREMSNPSLVACC